MEDLLVFSHLQHIMLGGLTISLNNALCNKLAIGWSDLVEFYFSAPRDPMAVLFSTPNTLSPPQPPSVKTPVDLGRLVTFAKHCPNLTRLHLSIPSDTTELPRSMIHLLPCPRPTRSACMRISVDAVSSPKPIQMQRRNFSQRCFLGEKSRSYMLHPFAGGIYTNIQVGGVKLWSGSGGHSQAASNPALAIVHSLCCVSVTSFVVTELEKAEGRKTAGFSLQITPHEAGGED
ncbi:hypothetical protein EDB19DRAFT_1731304 [Suillus lakei]|nr:hypothetical protein EDB19DRAFT_1731304 [Suillus lakei]